MTAIPTFKRVLCITVPTQDNIKSFLHQKAPNYFSDVTFKIHRFLENSMDELGTPINRSFIISTGELVKNSFDSFATYKLKNAEHLEIKVVISLADDRLVIKFKDNGNGFAKHPKSEYFSYKKKLDRQPKRGLHGGQGFGLIDFNETLKKCGGTLDIKNRKKEGCTIRMSFRLGRENSMMRAIFDRFLHFCSGICPVPF